MVPMLLRITRVHQASHQSRDPWREKGNGGAEKEPGQQSSRCSFK